MRHWIRTMRFSVLTRRDALTLTRRVRLQQHRHVFNDCFVVITTSFGCVVTLIPFQGRDIHEIGDSSTVEGRDVVEGEGTEASKFGFTTILDVIIEVLLMTQCLFYGSIISCTC